MGVRTTNNMLINNMMNYVGVNLSRLDKYQQQLATGKIIQRPSDNPIIAARALKLRTDVFEIDQFQRNTRDGLSWMEVTEQTLGQMGDVLQRSRELAVQAANSTVAKDDLLKIKKEVEQLKGQIINLGNATYAGRYLFSGFSTDTKLMNSDGTFAIDVSNLERINYEIGIGDTMNINVIGGDLLNSGASAVSGTKGKFIQMFDDFITKIDTGENGTITDVIGDMDDAQSNLLRVTADVGARINRLELTETRLESDLVNFTKLMSENEDIDMAEVIMKLKNEENVYKASLAGGARIIQPTLIDFLR